MCTKACARSPAHIDAPQLLCAFFCLAATASHGVSVRAKWALTRFCGVLGIPICFAAAVLAKETGVTLIGILAAQAGRR